MIRKKCSHDQNTPSLKFPLTRKRHQRLLGRWRSPSWRDRRHRQTRGRRAWQQPGAERSWRRPSRNETQHSPAVSYTQSGGWVLCRGGTRINEGRSTHRANLASLRILTMRRMRKILRIRRDLSLLFVAACLTLEASVMHICNAGLPTWFRIINLIVYFGVVQEKWVSLEAPDECWNRCMTMVCWWCSQTKTRTGSWDSFWESRRYCRCTPGPCGTSQQKTAPISRTAISTGLECKECQATTGPAP